MRRTIDKAGRLVIPKSLRDRAGVSAGEVEICVDGAAVRIRPIDTDELVEADGGNIAKTDFWGRRRYAYPINHKLEGIYTVFEIVTPASNLNELDRFLRLADDVVRHKIMRLPEAEAEKRGLLGEPVPAAD